MFIVYVVNDLSHIAGGIKVILEHANRIAISGEKVEIWVSNTSSLPYFQCNVPIKLIVPEQLNSPDVVVLTDQAFIPMTALHRVSKKTFLLMQHDTAWLAMVNRIPNFVDLIIDYKAHFIDGGWQILVVSTWLKDNFLKRYGINSIVVPNGVDLEQFRPTTPMFETSKPAVLLYYDPQAWKGFLQAATAAIEVKKVYQTASIIIIGAVFPRIEQPSETGIRFTFPSIFFNMPEQHQMASIYSSASMFISASWGEGYGLPGLEAMACGVPVLTTQSGGVSEYAVDGKTALVVPPMDTGALINGALRILADQKLSSRLSKNGLKHAQEHTWQKTIDKLKTVLLKP